MKTRFGAARRIGAVPALLLCLAAAAPSQTGPAGVAGSVTDASSARRIPAVLITAVQDGTGLSRTALSNASGMYEIPFLATGRYEVRASGPGYAAAVLKGIEVGRRGAARVDFALSPAADGAEAVVRTVRPAPAADGAELVRSVVRGEIEALPLIGRDFASLQILSPGVQPASAIGELAGRALSEGFRIGGGTMYSGAFSIERADNNRGFSFGNASLPSLEMIQEVQILRAGAASDHGGGAYRIDVSLRSGGSRYHGSIFEYLQHDGMSAANALSGADPPHLRRNQYGASLSGPLRKDALFFFGSHEGIRQRESQHLATQVATAGQRDGLFPAAGPDAVAIRDPAAGSQFPGNQIPASRFSPLARFFLDHAWPLPNSGTQLYRADVIPVVDSDRVDAKADFIRGRSEAYSLRLSKNRLAFDERNMASLVSPRSDRFDNFALTLRFTRTVRPGMANSLLLSARRDNTASLSRPIPGQTGSFIDGIGMSLGGPATPGLPLINISGRGFAGRTGDVNTPLEHSGNLYQVQDTLRWTIGRHNLGFGFEAKRYQKNEMDDRGAASQLSFNGRYSGSGLADFFLGLPNQVTYAPALGRMYFRNSLWSAFAQDDWKIRSNLTLNLGLRYEFLSWPTERYDRMATSHPHLGMRVIVSSGDGELPARLDPAAIASYPAGTFVASSDAGLPRSLRFPDRNNFAPRAGLAYRLPSDLILRASYGIDYLKETQAVFNDREASFGLPFRISRAVVNPNPLAFNILRPFADYSARARNTIESAWYVDPHYRMAYVQTWSLSLERSLPLRTVLQVGFVGNHLVRGRQAWNWNQSPSWPNRYNRFAGYVNILALTNDAGSRYNALQVEARRQATRGLSGQVNYTWSKNLTNVVDDGGAVSIWVHDPSMQWGRGRWSRTHVVTGSFIYDLPFGRWSRRLDFLHLPLERIFGQWRLSGIARVMSGKPFTVTSSLARANLDVQGNVPADRLASGRLENPNSGRWFDPAAFATPPAYRPGDAGYGILDGPGFITEDLALYRSFRVREAARIQLRLEAYDAFNHVHLGDPVTDVDNWSLLGKILTSGPGLRLQVALRVEF